MGIKVRRVVILCLNPLEIYMSIHVCRLILKEFLNVQKSIVFPMEIIIYPLNIRLFRKISNIAGKKYQ